MPDVNSTRCNENLYEGDNCRLPAGHPGAHLYAETLWGNSVEIRWKEDDEWLEDWDSGCLEGKTDAGIPYRGSVLQTSEGTWAWHVEVQGQTATSVAPTSEAGFFRAQCAIECLLELAVLQQVTE